MDWFFISFLNYLLCLIRENLDKNNQILNVVNILVNREVMLDIFKEIININPHDNF